MSATRQKRQQEFTQITEIPKKSEIKRTPSTTESYTRAKDAKSVGTKIVDNEAGYLTRWGNRVLFVITILCVLPFVYQVAMPWLAAHTPIMCCYVGAVISLVTGCIALINYVGTTIVQTANQAWVEQIVHDETDVWLVKASWTKRTRHAAFSFVCLVRNNSTRWLKSGLDMLGRKPELIANCNTCSLENVTPSSLLSGIQTNIVVINDHVHYQ